MVRNIRMMVGERLQRAVYPAFQGGWRVDFVEGRARERAQAPGADKAFGSAHTQRLCLAAVPSGCEHVGCTGFRPRWNVLCCRRLSQSRLKSGNLCTAPSWEERRT